MSHRAQFLTAWAVGAAAVVGTALVGDGFLALALVAGVLLLSLGARLLVAHRPRLVAGGLLFMAGSGWMLGGIVGLLALMGITGSDVKSR
jgi:hypothetical protein